MPHLARCCATALLALLLLAPATAAAGKGGSRSNVAAKLGVQLVDPASRAKAVKAKVLDPAKLKALGLTALKKGDLLDITVLSETEGKFSVAAGGKSIVLKEAANGSIARAH